MPQDSSCEKVVAITTRVELLERQLAYTRGLWKGWSVSGALFMAFVAAWLGFDTVWRIPTVVKEQVDKTAVTKTIQESLTKATTDANAIERLLGDANTNAIVIEKTRMQVVNGDDLKAALDKRVLQVGAYPTLLVADGSNESEAKTKAGKSPLAQDWTIVKAHEGGNWESNFSPKFGTKVVAAWFCPTRTDIPVFKSNDPKKGPSWSVRAARADTPNENQVTVIASADKDGGAIEGIVYVLYVDAAQ